MPKYIHLKLVTIKHRGHPVGNDIRVEVSCRDLRLDVKRKLKRDSTVDVNTEIGKIYTDETNITLKISIKVIEQDSIFNDIGSNDVTIKVNFNTLNPQVTTHDVEVRERRGPLEGKASAFFLLS